MLVQIDGTFIVAAISFIIFMIIMKYILFKPMSTVIEQREKFYEKNKKTALESKHKAKSVIEEKEKELSLTRASASNLVKEVSVFASKNRQEAIRQAKLEASKTLNSAKEELLKQSEAAKEELKAQINDFVSQIASKVLERDVAIKLEEEKINKIIKGANNA